MPKAKDPIKIFSDLFKKAEKNPNIPDATAMNLATASKKAKPSSRMVLLKGFSDKGFVFYTNLDSKKGQDLKENPYAALCIYWEPLHKQIRIEGKVSLVSDEVADEYFASRPFLSKVGAWASKQSSKITKKNQLKLNVAKFTAKFSIKKHVPRPKNWSGFIVVPNRIEFWTNKKNRLHDREVFILKNKKWEVETLYP